MYDKDLIVQGDSLVECDLKEFDNYKNERLIIQDSSAMDIIPKIFNSHSNKVFLILNGNENQLIEKIKNTKNININPQNIYVLKNPKSKDIFNLPCIDTCLNLINKIIEETIEFLKKLKI